MKNGDRLVELVRRRNSLERAYRAFSCILYMPGWIYWLDFNKGRAN